MGSLTRPGGKRALGIGLLGLALFAFPCLPTKAASSRAERLRVAKDQFRQAKRLRADLDGTPKKHRKAADYTRVIALYRRVYDIAPFNGIAADALAAAAEMYHEMGSQFGRKYWQEAIGAYRFLQHEYPHSRYADDALFNIAQIQHVHLKDPKTALRSYRAFTKRYPRSRYVSKARDAVKLIKAQQAAARKARTRKTAAAQPKAKPPGKRVSVRNVRFWNTKNYTRVVVDLEGEVKYQGARIEKPDRIFFDLFNTELSTVLEGKTFDVADGLLNRIRVAENRRGVTRVVLEVNHPEDFSVFSLPNPFRLVVDIRGSVPSRTAKKRASPKTPRESARGTQEPPASQTASASLPQPPTAPKPTRDGNHTLARTLGLKVGRIVIDAGHGGSDTGTIGPTGLMEKDLVLDVARRLGRLLEEKLGAKVIYTREDDSFVPLENRTGLANEHQADLFLSIHANSSRNRRVRGVETFYLDFSNDPEVRALAARENALSQKSLHELQDVLRKITRSEKRDESRELAREIQQQLHGGMHKLSRKVQNRGVKRAPFVVLVGANMPSVLAEVAFLSNRQDEKLMKGSKGRQAVAEALFVGMSNYLEGLNSLAAARAPDETADSQD
ncbi:MAG: N-acetylmuramoyl-L-alanine amidase [Terriglobia bacterium]